MATDIGYAVPDDSLAFWKDRLQTNNVVITGRGQRFGEEFLSFEDPDGLPLTFIIPAKGDGRKPWETPEVNSAAATRGFHSVTLSLSKIADTAKVLTEVLGYQMAGQEGNRYRFFTDASETANIVDLIEAKDTGYGVNAGGTVHHIAFRVKDEDTLMSFREKVLDHGLNITQKIDRNYFFSLYFREPGGVLFELATDNPGFATDETVAGLGSSLRLPPQYEPQRERIEKVLPVLA